MTRPKPEFSWIDMATARSMGLDDMLALHWEEVEGHQDVSPMDVDWGAYRDLERRDQLRIGALTLADELIGYNVFFLHRPLHSRSTLWAIGDVLYLDPAHRRGWAGVRLVKAAEAGLRSMGAKLILYAVKPDRNLSRDGERDTASRLLERLGYSPFERSWTKAL